MIHTTVIIGSSIFVPRNNNNNNNNITNLSTSTNHKPSSSSRSPLFSTVQWNLTAGHRHSHKYLANLASKLVLAGRFDDFLMLAESLVVSGVKPSEFVELVNLDLISSGIVRMIKVGKVRGLLRFLNGAQKLGFIPAEFFDKPAVEALSLQCRRLVESGELDYAVYLMKTLAGFGISIKELVEPSEVIKVCVKKRNPNAAIRHALIFPDAHFLFCNIILQFGKSGDLASALTVFEASKQNLSSPNMYIYRSMIDVCGLCGDYLRSRFIYEELLAENVIPNLYVFNSLMSVNASDLNYTLQIYKHMKKIGVAADIASFNILLKSCCFAARVDLAQDIYRELQVLESRGAVKLDLFTYSTIIKVFADAKMWQMALQIKEDMIAAGIKLNTVTWSSLIKACANSGVLEQAIKLFEEMLQANCEPNTYCCNILLNAFVEARQYDRAFSLFRSWKRKPDACDSRDLGFVLRVPFRPCTTTYNTLLKACGSDYHRAKALINEMKTLGLSPDLVSWSILIDICGGARNVEGALEALTSMREAGIQPDVVAYTAAIKVCVRNKHLEAALSLYSEMKTYQIRPNQVTYNTLLRARTRYGSVQQVLQCLGIYQDMRKAGYESNDYYLKALIEEWCEGVLTQDNYKEGQNQGQHHRVGSSNRIAAEFGGSRSLLLEKVAAHLQNNDSKTPIVDLRGLTKVEARIVVLAVLRMIKENYIPGDPIKDDMSIILGIQEVGASVARQKFHIKEAIIKLLQGELGLEVLLFEGSKIVPLSRNKLEENGPTRSEPPPPTQLESPSQSLTPTRRPADLQRLKVPKESLLQWLERRRTNNSKR